VRMGINLGPVKLAQDLNGYPKIIGDGLNVAERIMGFARPGQIAVSRSFFDMVSRLSDRYAKLFRFEGARTDKNAREHQVYVIDAGVGLETVTPKAAGEPSAMVAFLEDKLKVAAAAALLLGRRARAAGDRSTGAIWGPRLGAAAVVGYVMVFFLLATRS